MRNGKKIWGLKFVKKISKKGTAFFGLWPTHTLAAAVSRLKLLYLILWEVPSLDWKVFAALGIFCGPRPTHTPAAANSIASLPERYGAALSYFFWPQSSQAPRLLKQSSPRRSK